METACMFSIVFQLPASIKIRIHQRTHKVSRIGKCSNMMTQTHIEGGWRLQNSTSCLDRDHIHHIFSIWIRFSPEKSSGLLSFFCSQVFAQQQVVADAIFCDLAKTCVADRWLVAVTSVTVTTEAASMAEVRARLVSHDTWKMMSIGSRCHVKPMLIATINSLLE
jgi:hypothetical protein